MTERKHNGKALDAALAERLSEDGRPVAFDRRLNVLNFSGLKMRVRLLWPTVGEVGQVWRIRVEQIKRDVEFDLLIRMEELSRPKDFFIVKPADLVIRFPHWLIDPVPAELSRFWCRSSQKLLDRIEKICARPARHCRLEHADRDRSVVRGFSPIELLSGLVPAEQRAERGPPCPSSYPSRAPRPSSCCMGWATRRCTRQRRCRAWPRIGCCRRCV